MTTINTDTAKSYDSGLQHTTDQPCYDSGHPLITDQAIHFTRNWIWDPYLGNMITNYIPRKLHMMERAINILISLLSGEYMYCGDKTFIIARREQLLGDCTIFVSSDHIFTTMFSIFSQDEWRPYMRNGEFVDHTVITIKFGKMKIKIKMKLHYKKMRKREKALRKQEEALKKQEEDRQKYKKIEEWNQQWNKKQRDHITRINKTEKKERDRWALAMSLL